MRPLTRISAPPAPGPPGYRSIVFSHIGSPPGRRRVWPHGSGRRQHRAGGGDRPQLQPQRGAMPPPRLGTASLRYIRAFGTGLRPAQDEVLEYARWLGIDTELDQDLLWIAREGLKVRPAEPCGVHCAASRHLRCPHPSVAPRPRCPRIGSLARRWTPTRSTTSTLGRATARGTTRATTIIAACACKGAEGSESALVLVVCRHPLRPPLACTQV